MRIRALILVLSFAAAACTGSHTPPEEPAGGSAAAQIGPRGGTLELGDLQLVIPPGALPSMTEVRVTATDTPAPGSFTAFTRVYRFEPDGLSFAAPARISIPFAGDATVATVFWTSARGGGYVALPTTVRGNVAEAEVRHFSSAFVGSGCAGEDCCRRATGELDVLVMVDNSNSMAEEQASLAEQFPRLARALATGDLDADGVQDFPAVQSLHFGVVSSDMGVGGFNVPTCNRDPNFGDDGVLRMAGSTTTSGCGTTYPSYLTYDADDLASDPDAFAFDASCVAVMGTGGCGFEQQLEASLKALTPSTSGMTFHGGTLGHGDGTNTGFLRDGSILAVLAITDENDASAADAELFNPSSTLYTGDLNLRAFMYPEALHATERFSDGLLDLRDDAASLVLAAITGVPPELSGSTDYTAILDAGAMQERLSAEMPTRLEPSCSVEGRGIAFPPRRLVEAVRDVDESGGAGVLHSICADDYTPAVDAILEVVASRLAGACGD